jgi:hypothetical protein
MLFVGNTRSSEGKGGVRKVHYQDGQRPGGRIQKHEHSQAVLNQDLQNPIAL